MSGFENELHDATNDTGPTAAASAASDIPTHFHIECDPINPTLRHSPSELERDVFGGDSPLSSAPSSRSPSPFKNSRQRRSKRRSRAKQTEGRRAERERDIESTRMPKERAKQKHVAHAVDLPLEYSVEDIPSASTGYVALRDEGGRVHTLQELLDDGFQLIKWDGRTTMPLVDSNGLVVSVLVSSPNDPGWQDVHEEAFRLLRENAEACNFSRNSMDHRRGNFAALNTGISFGGGPQMPGNLYHPEKRAEVLERLTASPCFVRLAGFASSAFSTWMPKLYQHYNVCLSAVLGHHPSLSRNFPNSVWAAVAFNFGPRTVTRRHRDAANLPYGICSITALGHYNYVEGGHLVLWEFGLVVEFPPGSTVLIPSAAVTHSNTPVGPDEKRCSFTQYSAGGLFRWVDQGFQKSGKYLASLSDAELEELPKRNEARCALGMSLFSTLEDLRKPSNKSASSTTKAR